MNTFTLIMSKIATFLALPILSIYALIVRRYRLWEAHQRKCHSLRALEKLDAHLLDDIGLQRINGRIVAIRQSALGTDATSVRHHRRKVRLRCHFLVRRRHRLRSKR